MCQRRTRWNLGKAGIPVVQIDYHAQTMERHIQSMQLIGDLLERQVEPEN